MRASRLVVAAVLLVLGTAFSCKTFDIPNEICDPSRQHGGELVSPLSDATCNRCLEDRCCDSVGVCEGKEGCTDAVAAVHACVLREGLAGARKEVACADAQGLGTKDEANTAYRCMRDQCGSECGLPVCRVDPAAPLIQSAECDGCFASSCCPQLNECYASRACKLTIECIVRECGASLGSTLAPGTVPDFDASATGSQNICPIEGGPVPIGPPSCIRKCVCDFKDNDQGLLPTDPAKRPINLALNVYRCGVSAGCGPSCTPPPK